MEMTPCAMVVLVTWTSAAFVPDRAPFLSAAATPARSTSVAATLRLRRQRARRLGRVWWELAQLDLDQDGICDDVDDCVGNSCLGRLPGICNGPGAIGSRLASDLMSLRLGRVWVRQPSGDTCWRRMWHLGDCDGNQLDALVCVWCGSCVQDLDQDGICDDVDECVGTLDACGICNGPGEIYECGCANIPAGDCDCNGSQLDALGVCGGACTADADGDGICDDVDGCVTLDACGICNGWRHLRVLQHGGDCDCGVDALGVCGGACVDL